MSAPPPDPYRLLFPLGATFAILGAGLWPLALLPGVPYPAVLHASLMIEGFELSFVSGFLLTLLPRVTRTDPTPAAATRGAFLLLVLFGAAAIAGRAAIAQACVLALLLFLAGNALRRMRARRNDPPEELLFVGFGLALGIAGVILQMGAAAGWWVEPAPRLGIRLVSLGMVLALVLGFGTLLVPAFLEIKDPLVLPRIARPHERPRRRALYLTVGAGLALTFALDALGVPAAAAFGRAAIASFMLGVGWKAWRRPGRRTFPATVLWLAGWTIGLGLWAAALLPRYEIAALHVVMLGGYGALTLAIASRVFVTHGGHGPDREDRLVTPARAALLALALVLRLVAEGDPAHRAAWLAAAAGCWIAAWAGWLLAGRSLRAVPSSA